MVRFPWGSEVGLAGEESQEKVFVLCFCVWRVRHHFSEGVCKVRSSKVRGRAESLGGCRAESSAVALGQVGTSQSWRK